MTEKPNRREVLKRMAATGAVLALRGSLVAQSSSATPGLNLEIEIVSVSEHTFRLSIFPGQRSVAADESLLQEEWGKPAARLHGEVKAQTVRGGNVNVQISGNPASRRSKQSATCSPANRATSSDFDPIPAPESARPSHWMRLEI